MTTLSLLAWLFEVTLKGSVVIALVALAVSLFGSRLGARWRHALWLIVLIRLAVPIAPSSTWSIFNFVPSPDIQSHTPQFAVRVSPASAPEAMHRASIELQPTWWGRYGTLVVSIWGAGALLVLLRLLVASKRLNQNVRIAEASRDDEAARRIHGIVDAARLQVGMRRHVDVIVAPSVKTPALQGIVRPKLLLPEIVARSFGHREVRHIVLHELWHLRRHDVAVNWVLSLIEVVHWFNPLVWFAVARIREEREICCDELALSCLEEEERIGYGGTILRLLEEFRTAAAVPALVGIVNHKQLMKRRLMMIATYPSRKRSSALYIGLVALVGAVAFTDANGGEGTKKMMRKIHPGAHEQMSKLHTRTSLNLTSASIGDLLNTVSSASGVTITQSPEVATSNIQNARFTINASNVPVHLVLMNALAPFDLTAEPTETGISIEPGKHCGMVPPHAVAGDGHAKRELVSVMMRDGDAAAAEGEVKQFRIYKKQADAAVDGEPAMKTFRIVTKDGEEITDSNLEKKIVSMTAKEHVGEDVMIMRHDGEAGDKKHVMIHDGGMREELCKLDADGKLHREFKLKISENGVESEGTMTLDIATK